MDHAGRCGLHEIPANAGVNQTANARAVKAAQGGLGCQRGYGRGARAGIEEAAFTNAAHEFDSPFRKSEAVVAGFEAALQLRGRDDALGENMPQGLDTHVLERCVQCHFPQRANNAHCGEPMAGEVCRAAPASSTENVRLFQEFLKQTKYLSCNGLRLVGSIAHNALPKEFRSRQCVRLLLRNWEARTLTLP